MYFYILIRQILRDMWAWKLRSFLALFGIVWGTITVILLLALGHGFSTASRTNMIRLVDGTFFVIPQKTSKFYQGYSPGRTLNIKAATVMNLKQAVPNIKYISPSLITRTNIRFANKQVSKELFGVNSSFAYLQKVDISMPGRFLNPLDVKNRRFVAVIGNNVKEQLFANKTAVGKQISINNANFTVIGVTTPPAKNVYNWYKNKVLIPYTAYKTLFGDQNSVFFIVFPDPEALPGTVKNSMFRYLAKKLHFDPQDKAAIRVFDTTKIFQFMRWFFIGVQIFLGLCGALTLGVGSLGVANIMFLIVSERTREIGIRMSLGAKDWQILLQILLEALIIVVVGGMLGFLFSYILVVILQHIALPEWLGQPQISAVATTTTIIVLALLGVFAGYFPARRAAKMDPVVALGY